jgi:hypothetical protein
MATLLFDIQALRPIIDHASVATRHAPTFSMMLDPQYLKPGRQMNAHGYIDKDDIDDTKVEAHLQLVKDRGCYLMSSGVPRLLDPTDASGQRSQVVYADGMRPEDGPWATDELGGDDFVEVVNLAFARKIASDGASHLVVEITESSIVLSAVWPEGHARRPA